MSRLPRVPAVRMLLPLILGMLAGGICLPSGRAETIALSEYRTLVAACRRETERGLTPQEAARWSARLGAVRTVTYPDGGQVAVDNKDLSGALGRAAAAGPAPDRRKARDEAAARLRTLQALLSLPQEARHTADPREQAVQIVAAEEFRRAAEEAKRKKSWWDTQWERIGRAIARFLERLFGNGPQLSGGSGTLGRGVVFVLYFAAAVAGVVAVFLLARSLRDRRAHRRRAAGAAADLSDDALPDPLVAARERAAAGDYRTALRLTYLSCLRRLAAAGLLVLEEDKTNWEYQRALKGRSREAHDTLLPVTRDFDRIWYGHAPATRDEYERAVAALDALPEERFERESSASAHSASRNEGNPW